MVPSDTLTAAAKTTQTTGSYILVEMPKTRGTTNHVQDPYGLMWSVGSLLMGSQLFRAFSA